MLVVGISGVGKTTACMSFTSKHPNFTYLSASAILVKATGLSSEQLRNTSEQNIVSRQMEIEKYATKMRAELPQQSFIIDGHAVIDNGVKLINVPLSTFQAISPDLIIHLSLDPAELFERRRVDNRSRPSRTANELSQYQSVSENRALLLAQSLGIPFHIVSAGNFTLFSFSQIMSKLY